jgi:hypothetical protein
MKRTRVRRRDGVVLMISMRAPAEPTLEEQALRRDRKEVV